jgi:hypothetical protein
MGKVLHASGSGYFPYCIQESTDSRYAIWSLENAMKTYWRVRSWNFSASGIFYYDADPFYYPFSSYVGGIQSGSYYDNIYTEEEQLLCGGSGFYSGDEYSDQSAIIQFGAIKMVDSLYTTNMNGYIYDVNSAIEYSFRSPTPSFAEVSSTISICGGTLPIGARRLETGEPEPLISLDSASLTPASWWSYGGTYDTATGAPL